MVKKLGEHKTGIGDHFGNDLSKRIAKRFQVRDFRRQFNAREVSDSQDEDKRQGEPDGGRCHCYPAKGAPPVAQPEADSQGNDAECDVDLGKAHQQQRKSPGPEVI